MFQRAPLVLAAIVAAGVASAGAPYVGAQRPAFRAGVRTVAVFATVQDARGTLVTDLARDDFEVFEDGVPRDVVQFSADPQPLNVVVMLETSQRMLGPHVPLNLRLQYRDAIMAFVEALRPGDRARIGTFGLQVALGAHLTSDRTELRRVLDEETWAGGEAPLWQALIAGMRSIDAEPDRRVVLALTNGINTGNIPGHTGGRSTAESQAAECGCLVYAVTLESRDVGEDLKEVATTTGGGYVRIVQGGDVHEAFLRIAEELRHQYLIGFVPIAADGLAHRIDVRARRPGHVVRARQTFVAEVQ